jgi:hypothetical protein
MFERLNKNILFNEVIQSSFSKALQFHDRYQLYDFINTRFILNQRIQYLEFGVREGASMKKWCEINTNPRSTFYEFSAFWDYTRSFYKSWQGVAFTTHYTQAAIVLT